MPLRLERVEPMSAAGNAGRHPISTEFATARAHAGVREPEEWRIQGLADSLCRKESDDQVPSPLGGLSPPGW